MDLSKLNTPKSTKKSKRVGRGTGSGKGKTSGRGHKGAGQRAGRTLPYIGFRGGNLTYLRKIPKRGFTSPHHKEFQVVNLSSIAQVIKQADEITPELLKEANLIRDEKKPVKILAKVKGDFSLKATFKAHRFSRKAVEIITSVGGTIERLDPSVKVEALTKSQAALNVKTESKDVDTASDKEAAT